MTDEQLIRFDFYMKSHFKKNKIKEIIINSLQPKFQDTIITDEMAIVVASLAKLYVGELVETGFYYFILFILFYLIYLIDLFVIWLATEVLKADKDEPPGLRPQHIL